MSLARHRPAQAHRGAEERWDVTLPQIEHAALWHLPGLLRILWALTRNTAWLPVRRSRWTDLRLLARFIRAKQVRMLCENARPVAFLARHGAQVHALYVHPAHQGRGYGQLLIEEAQASGALELWTHAENLPARRFYGLAGFQEVETGHANDEGVADVRLVWRKETER